jgi:hypothetical protein
MQEEQEATRFSPRLQGHANMDIMDKVLIISKNRNFEGLEKESDKEVSNERARKLKNVVVSVFS